MSAQIQPKYAFAYDKIGTLADVYLPNPSERLAVPTVLYWHGGGLSCGDRRSYLPIWFITKLLDNGYIFISADYRLLPPSTGHVILQDVLGFTHWAASPNGLNAQLKQHGDTVSVDTTRLIAAGTSAGGYLAYLAGIYARVQNPLRGVLSLPRVTDSMLDAPLFAAQEQAILPWSTPTRSCPIRAFTQHHSPTACRLGIPLEYGPDGIPSSPRMFMTRVLLQEGIFLDYLTGEHGLSGRLVGLETPSMFNVPEQHHLLFPEACVSSSFPPTCLVHGTEDSAVLIGESRAMRDRLQAVGVHCELFEVVGAEHSFDYAPGHEEVLDKVFQVVKGWLM
ncbi:alpha/beta hydrolase family protein [Ceratobasidium sp. AG-Ba]|nr:alpha/beta hydrolase family protein [Ceratobasidium sp. AG-Ba]